MIRYGLYFVAVIMGGWAIASWVYGLLTDAGISAAVSAACVLLAEFAAYCERRSWERARRVREEVWERRDAECYGAVWPHEVGGFE